MITVNGSGREFRGSVAELVQDVAPGRDSGIAVAVNDAVVPRGAWRSTLLADGDRVEVLTAVQGG